MNSLQAIMSLALVGIATSLAMIVATVLYKLFTYNPKPVDFEFRRRVR